MKFIRDLGDELVERRLWPVVLLLVGALVAVFVLLPKHSSLPATRAAASPVVPSPSVPASISVVAETAGSGRGLGALPRHNPFQQRSTAKAKSSIATAPGPGLTTASAPGPAASSKPAGGATGPAGGAGTGSTAATPGKAETKKVSKPRTYPTVSIAVSFGPVAGRQRSRTLPQLVGLPGSADPVVIFLGVVEHSRTAAFIIPSDTHAAGEGRCLPSPAKCKTVLLRAGQTEFFDVTKPSAAVIQYELRVKKVTFGETRSRTAAAGAFVRLTRPGVRTLRRRLAERASRGRRAGDFSVPAASALDRANRLVLRGLTAGARVKPAPAETDPPSPPPSSIGSLRDHGSPAAGP